MKSFGYYWPIVRISMAIGLGLFVILAVVLSVFAPDRVGVLMKNMGLIWAGLTLLAYPYSKRRIDASRRTRAEDSDKSNAQGGDK